MRLGYAALAALLLLAPSLTQGALAQGIPRIRATILSFDGQTLNVTSGAGSSAQTMRIGVLPTTRYLTQEKRAFIDVAAGDYIGATVTILKDGILHAQEIHIFPEELRGSGEGVFPAGADRSMIDATVRTVGTGILTVDYRGAQGGDGPTCTGRAPAGPAPNVCHGSADILVAAGVPVTALVTGDKSLLVPGAVIALSVMAGPDGRPVTPGLTVEGMAPEPEPASAAPIPSRPGR